MRSLIRVLSKCSKKLAFVRTAIMVQTMAEGASVRGLPEWPGPAWVTGGCIEKQELGNQIITDNSPF